MYLVCRKDGRMNIELTDTSSTRILETVREHKNGFPGGRLEIRLHDDIWQYVLPGTHIKLLMSKEDGKHFDLNPTKPESLIVPKK